MAGRAGPRTGGLGLPHCEPAQPPSGAEPRRGGEPSAVPVSSACAARGDPRRASHVRPGPRAEAAATPGTSEPSARLGGRDIGTPTEGQQAAEIDRSGRVLTQPVRRCLRTCPSGRRARPDVSSCPLMSEHTPARVLAHRPRRRRRSRHPRERHRGAHRRGLPGPRGGGRRGGPAPSSSGIDGRCVVLLDLAMPRMNGLEFLTELSRRGRYRTVPGAGDERQRPPRRARVIRRSWRCSASRSSWTTCCAGSRSAPGAR